MGIQCLPLAYRSLAAYGDFPSPFLEQSNSSSPTFVSFSRRYTHVPHFTYPQTNYPHDHIINARLKKRLDVLVPMEQRVISFYSNSETYRRDYYANCFDSLVPLSDNGSEAFLEKNRDNVYLGVKHNAQGDCDGCPRKKPIRFRTIDRRIRKFVGNREVYDINTRNHGLLLFLLSF